MHSFLFEGTDKAGSRVEGTVQASNAEAAVRALSAQGYRLRRIGPAPQAAPPVPAGRPPAPVPARPAPLATVGTALPAAPPAQAARLSYWRPFRTRPASHADLHFFFSQMARLLRAGVSPAHMAGSLMPGHPSARLREACRALGAGAAEGRSLASVMEGFPDVFGPEAVGAVRAGEAGGYLPDAFAMLAAQEESARSLAWKVRIPRWQVLAAATGGALAVAWTAGSRRMVADIMETVGSSPGERIGVLWAEFVRQLAGPLGWLLFGSLMAYATVALWAKHWARRPLRHRLAARLPVVSSYLRAQALMVFSEHLSRLSSAGLAPSAAWGLAASAVPNVAISDELLARGMPSESATMFELASGAAVLPPEVRQLVATGEATGTLPDAFGQAARLAASEQERAHRSVTVGWYMLALLLSAVLVAFALATFYAGWYDQIFKSALGDVFGEDAGLAP
jgi:type IV pilus assembly protein PilC